MQIVDAQIHLWTNDRAPAHHQRAPFLIDDALRGMDAAGVDRAVNCPAVWDPDANAYAVVAATRHPDRFATLGWFDLDRDPDDGLIGEFVAQPGMLGLRFLIMSPAAQALLTDGRLEWIWAAADHLALPVGLMLSPRHYGLVADIARRYPRMRLLLDHLGAPPFATGAAATAHLADLLALAAWPNIAVKATGLPSIATDDYPFRSVHPMLKQVLGAFGATRTFWGTDITRLHCSWSECVRLFTEELDGLDGADLELVMGRAVQEWIGWT